MKQLALLFAILSVSVFAHAQTPKYDNNKKISSKAPLVPDKLKVTLTNDTLYIVYKNREVPAANLLVLDSLIKKGPVKEYLNVEFDSMNADPEKIKAINNILKKCECPTIRRNTNFPKQQ